MSDWKHVVEVSRQKWFESFHAILPWEENTPEYAAARIVFKLLRRDSTQLVGDIVDQLRWWMNAASRELDDEELRLRLAFDHALGGRRSGSPDLNTTTRGPTSFELEAERRGLITR